jgi:hypothetical protein
MTRHSGRPHVPTRASIALFAFAVLLAATMVLTAAAPNPQSSTPKAEQKVEKEFYTPKDRQAAMHSALLFTATTIADADIAAGPKQSKKQFIFHLNDKVTCDFDKPGASNPPAARSRPSPPTWTRSPSK